MKIPKYWAKGATSFDSNSVNPRTGKPKEPFSCWGWSDVSPEEARQQGSRRADAVMQIIRKGKKPGPYAYGDRPMREHVIEEWKTGSGETYAAVTRNAYGCRVLNTASIMFVDVDLPEPSIGGGFMHRLKRLFGGSEEPSPLELLERDAIAKAEQMAQADPGIGIRIYRTCAGFRHLLTHSHAQPDSAATREIMEKLGADPLYMHLCKMQGCFRARLTPKPWRCGMPALRIIFPWQDKDAEIRTGKWEQAYSQKANRFATCDLVKQLGSTAMDAETARVVDFHDRKTRVGSGLPKA
ncbi:MAG: hypothetical protein GY765_00430 [bacterium]|nr:hypothetical protein [bacterium]